MTDLPKDWPYNHVTRDPKRMGDYGPSPDLAFASGYVVACRDAIDSLDALKRLPMPVALREAFDAAVADIESRAWVTDCDVRRCDVFGDRGPES